MTKLRSDGKGGGYDVELSGLDRRPVADQRRRRPEARQEPDPERRRTSARSGRTRPTTRATRTRSRTTGGPPASPGTRRKVPGNLTTLGRPVRPGLEGPHRHARRPARGVRGRGLQARARSEHDRRRRSSTRCSTCSSSRSRSLRKYTDDDIGDMTSGHLWISHAWSGDWYQMIADKPTIKYVIPTDGAVRGNDTMVVLSGAPHPIAAQLWINFNLDPQVSAGEHELHRLHGPERGRRAVHRRRDQGRPAPEPAARPSSTSWSS